ncbi:hypothetical protein [Persephonella sp.]
MKFKTELGLGELLPLDLEIDQIINNVDIWYITLINILRNRFDYKAEFRIPKEDFHMELEPFGVEGIATLKVIHEQKKQGFIFKLRKPMIYTFAKIFEDIDKILKIQKLIVKKSDGISYFEDIPLPFQERYSLRYLLERYIFFGEKLPRYMLTWQQGRIELSSRRIRVYARYDDNFYPLREMGVNIDDCIKLLMVL